MKQVIVKINRLGDAKIEVNGFTGTGCVEATQGIEMALGGPTKRDLKPEYDQPAATGVFQETGRF